MRLRYDFVVDLAFFVVDGMGVTFKHKDYLAGIKEMVRSEYFSNLSYG